MKKFTFKVNGMHCKSCAMLIEDNLSEVSGLYNIKVGVDTHILELETNKNIEASELIKELNVILKKDGYRFE
jgi:copper chaperone CopZ